VRRLIAMLRALCGLEHCPSGGQRPWLRRRDRLPQGVGVAPRVGTAGQPDLSPSHKISRTPSPKVAAYRATSSVPLWESPVTVRNTLDHAGFVRAAQVLADQIESSRRDLHAILSQYESYETACHELSRSQSTLRGLGGELSRIGAARAVAATSTFFPINLPLYSLVLFAVAPAALSERVFVRPPSAVADILGEIARVLRLDQIVPGVRLVATSRRTFVDAYVASSDAVVFTGRHENVMALISESPDRLFIYNGRGINPVVVGPEAHIGMAVAKTVDMRAFNSGQDCAGPDAIFVSSRCYEAFIQQLRRAVLALPVGRYVDPRVRIGPLQRREYIHEIGKTLADLDGSVTLRGELNTGEGIVTPFIIESTVAQHTGPFPEFFAPIFLVLRYETEQELLDALNSEGYSDFAMYASVFGTTPFVNSRIPKSQVLICQTVNDVENGNQPYGGWGPKANFVHRDRRAEAHPILISRELGAYPSNNC
jgi:aldehyde dehydrogenase (NAD+)